MISERDIAASSPNQATDTDFISKVKIIFNNPLLQFSFQSIFEIYPKTGSYRLPTH